MTRNLTLAGAGLVLTATLAMAGIAWAGAADYAFEAVEPEVKMASDAVVAVRLVHRPSGRPVEDAVIFATRIDMAPDGMATMTAPLASVPGGAPGVYAFRTDLMMAGRWLLSLAAKVQGERETVVGRITITAIE